MKVQVEESLYIESDEYQYILREYTGAIAKPAKEGEEGRPVYKTHGYFPTIESALGKVLSMKIKASTAKDIKELIRDVEDIRNYIKETVSF
ncbi:hypothetical protein D3C72_988130 [compost metagenome]